MFLADVDAVLGGVPEQDVIELGADDLERGGALTGIIGEVPAPGFGGFAPDEGGTALDDESGRFDCGQRADLLQDGNAGGQQGLADVLAGESGALQQDDGVALVGRAAWRRRRRPVRRR